MRCEKVMRNSRAERPQGRLDCKHYMHHFFLRSFRRASFSLLFFPFAIGAAPFKTLPGHVPALAAVAQRLGGPLPAQELHLALGLPLRHSDMLAVLLEQLYNP